MRHQTVQIFYLSSWHLREINQIKKKHKTCIKNHVNWHKSNMISHPYNLIFQYIVAYKNMKIWDKVNQLKGQEFIFLHTDIWLQKTHQSRIHLTSRFSPSTSIIPCGDESGAQFHIFEGRQGWRGNQRQQRRRNKNNQNITDLSAFKNCLCSRDRYMI